MKTMIPKRQAQPDQTALIISTSAALSILLSKKVSQAKCPSWRLDLAVRRATAATGRRLSETQAAGYNPARQTQIPAPETEKMPDFLEVCRQAAQAGGDVLLSWRDRFSTREKGPRDLVTEADLAAQRA